MALPRDLRDLLWLQLPYTAIEEAPVSIQELWLAAKYPANFAARQAYQLTADRAGLQKLAAWCGVAAFSNQIWLPYGLTLTNAVRAGNVAIFADASLRGQRNKMALLLILRQMAQEPERAETLLAYFLTDPQAEFGDIPFAELVAQRISLSERGAEMVLRTLTRKKVWLYEFAAGMVAKLFDKKTASVAYTFGYLLSHNTISNYRFLGMATRKTIKDVMILLNRTDYIDLNHGLELHDEINVLNNLADEILSHVPVVQGDFPAEAIVYIMDAAVMQERARRMLPLVTARYPQSALRGIYLEQLRFLADPYTNDIDLNWIPPHLLAMFGIVRHFGMFSNNDSAMIDLIAEPARFVRSFAQHIRELEGEAQVPAREPSITLLHNVSVRRLLNAAVLTGQFAATSLALFELFPQFTREIFLAASPVKNVETKEELITAMAVTIKEPAPHLDIIVNNSLLLQQFYLQEQLEFRGISTDIATPLPILAFQLAFTDPTSGASGVLAVREPVTAYDYATWQQLGLELPAYPIADRRRAQVTELFETL